MVTESDGQLRRTARDWLQIAMDAREIAAWLSDPQAKRVMEDVADDCERAAQQIGAVTALAETALAPT
jgi:hypothetical protein